MAIQTKTYADIDLNFSKHPVSGDLVMRYDENAIKASIRHLLLTKYNDRSFNKEIGSNLMNILFEDISPVTVAVIKREITNTIQNFEPRARIDNIQVLTNEEQNEVTINLVFTAVGKFNPTSLSMAIGRTR